MEAEQLLIFGVVVRNSITARSTQQPGGVGALQQAFLTLVVVGLILGMHGQQVGCETRVSAVISPTPIPLEQFKRVNKPIFRMAGSTDAESLEYLAQLGRFLFFDPRLSRNGMMSCASCHNPSFFWTDSLSVSIEKGTRRSMSLLNVGDDENLTWQGRARSITSMVRLPLSAPRTMDADEALIAMRLSGIEGYRALFSKAYRTHLKGSADKELRSMPVDFASVGYALEACIATIVSPRSRFDEYVEGNTAAFTPQERSGFDLFRGKAGCAQCHAGWKLSDGKLYDIGLKISPDDPESAKGSTQFKAVGLRAIPDRPPYMHDGSFKTLEDVVEFYDRGGDEKRPSVSERIGPLHLSAEEKAELVLFLKALSEPPVVVTYPILPR